MQSRKRFSALPIPETQMRTAGGKPGDCFGCWTLFLSSNSEVAFEWIDVFSFFFLWRHYAGPLPQEKLTPEFLEMVQEAQNEPDKFAVLEICASLHVYTENLLLDLHKVSHWLVSCFFWMITMMMTILTT